MSGAEVWIVERGGYGHVGLYESFADVLVDFPDDAWRPEGGVMAGDDDRVIWSNWRDGEDHLESWPELVRDRLSR